MLSLLLFNAYRLINYHLIEQTKQRLTELQSSLSIALAGPLLARDYASLQSIIDGWVALKQFHYMLIEKRGQIVASSSWDKNKQLPSFSEPFSDKKEIHHTILDIEYSGQHLGRLHFGMDTSFLTNAKKELLSQGIGIALLELLLSGLLLFSIGIWLTKHILAITDASEKIISGNFDIAIRDEGEDEIALLAKSFNKMSAVIHKRESELKTLNENLQQIVANEVAKAKKREEVLFEQQRKNSILELLVNIAHQWRQPLNVMSLELGNIDYFVEEKVGHTQEIVSSIAKIEHEIAAISDLITYFTTIYEESEILRTQIVLKECIEESIKKFREMTHNASLAIQLYGTEDLTIYSDRNALIQVLLPIFHNTLDISIKRGIKEAVLRVSFFHQESHTAIILEDNCGGIDTQVLKTMFDPYTTTNFKTRNKGLGMFAVKNIVELKLRGTIEAENYSDGARLTITL